MADNKYDENRRFSKDLITTLENAELDYLHFNAYSMKDLLVRKLSANPDFTDQMYPGSNLAILVELVSYMYQTLIYQVNHAASESMFADTQYYENIIRLVNLIGYHPQGINPSTCMFRVDDGYEYGGWRILPFSKWEGGSQKSYSFCPVLYNQSLAIPRNITDGNSYDLLLVNGTWRVYKSEPLIATGEDWETFILTDIGSELESNRLVSTNNIFAVEVVQKDGTTGDNKDDFTVRWFSPTMTNLFKGKVEYFKSAYDVQSILYPGNVGGSYSNYFNVELNEKKQIILKFGNGLSTSKLKKDSKVYIFYLDTNGTDGEVDASETQAVITHSPAMFNGFGESRNGRYPIYEAVFNVTPDTENTTSIITHNLKKSNQIKELNGEEVSQQDDLKIHPISHSTPAEKEEDVETIREVAPSWFKLNNRLVTKEDYKFYVLNHPHFKSIFKTVSVMNNWDYVATFYRWLNQLGLQHHDNPNYYLNSSRFIKYGNASLSDPADCNNVYIWYITNYTTNYTIDFNQLVIQYKSILSDIKDLTHEPVFLPGVAVTCEISSMPMEMARRLLSYNNGRTTVSHLEDGSLASWLEVRMKDNFIISPADVKSQIAQIIYKFFSVQNKELGFGMFNTSDILNEIYSKIPSLSEVYTVYLPSVGAKPIYTNGISLACWTNNTTLIDLGDDLKISSGQIQLEDFQYPQFRTSNVKDITESIRVISNNNYYLSNKDY